MINNLFSDFCWFIDIKKKKKPLENALQIQYLVDKTGEEEGGNGVVRVQAINTFTRPMAADERSGDPLYFNIEFFHLLKMVTINQWILALTWEESMNKLAPKSASLLGGYILYYEKILDTVMGSGNVEILEKWMEIESKSNGKHMPRMTYSKEKDRDRHGVDVRTVLDFWNLKMVYEMEDLRKINEKDKKKIFSEVKKWLSDQCKKNQEIQRKGKVLTGELSVLENTYYIY